MALSSTPISKTTSTPDRTILSMDAVKKLLSIAITEPETEASSNFAKKYPILKIAVDFFAEHEKITYENYATVILNHPDYKKVLKSIRSNLDQHVKEILSYSHVLGDEGKLHQALLLLTFASEGQQVKKLVGKIASDLNSTKTKKLALKLLCKFGDSKSIATIINVIKLEPDFLQEASSHLSYHIELPVSRKFFYSYFQKPDLFNNIKNSKEFANRFKSFEIKTKQEEDLIFSVMNNGANPEHARFSAWLCLQANKKTDCSYLNNAPNFYSILESLDPDYAMHVINSAGLEEKTIKRLASIAVRTQHSHEERNIALTILAKATGNNPIDEISKHVRFSRKSILKNIAPLINHNKNLCSFFTAKELVGFVKNPISSAAALKTIEKLKKSEWKELARFILDKKELQIKTTFMQALLENCPAEDLPITLIKKFELNDNPEAVKLKTALLNLSGETKDLSILTEDLNYNFKILSDLAGQGSLEACKICVDCLLTGESNDRANLLADLEKNLDENKVKAFAKSLKFLSLDQTLPEEQKQQYAAYSQAISSGLTVNIRHPFRYLPQTFCKLVENRVNPKRTDQPTTIFLTSGVQDASMVIADDYMQKITKAHRVILFEISNQQEFLDTLTQIKGSVFAAADNLILSFHGAIGFITFDNTKYIECPSQNYLSIEDLKKLPPDLFSAILKEKANILNLACYGDNEYGINPELKKHSGRRVFGSANTGITTNILRHSNNDLLTPVLM